MNRFLVLSLLLLGGCLLALAGCRQSQTAPTLSDLATFRSDEISLRLPSLFKGGDPRDPQVFAALESVASRNSDPRMRSAAQSYLQSLESSIQEGDSPLELLLWTEPDSEGHMAQVLAFRGPPTDGSSLQDEVDNLYGDWTLEYQTQDRALMRCLNPVWDPNRPVLNMIAIVMGSLTSTGGKIPYYVEFTPDKESDPALEQVFRECVKTIQAPPLPVKQG